MSDRFASADGIDVVLVTFTSNELLDDYQSRRQLNIPVLLDVDRSAYTAYGLGRGSFRAVWGLATLRRYAEILAQSRRKHSGSHVRDLAPATEDTRQLGGDFVIAPDGRLTWGHWCTGPADRPTVEEIAQAIETIS